MRRRHYRDGPSIHSRLAIQARSRAAARLRDTFRETYEQLLDEERGLLGVPDRLSAQSASTHTEEP